MEGIDNPVVFKKNRNRNIRKRVEVDDESDEDNEDLTNNLEEIRALRQIRRRHGGVTAESLLAGNKGEVKEDQDEHPYKLKVGGMLDLNTLKNAPKMDDAYDTGIGTAFSAETNRRDEDAQMQTFIEENLLKRKGVDKSKEREEEENKEPKYLSPEEAALHAVPDYLRKSSTKKSEEMLSNQMLSGIPEVDLGLEAKIKNIEATEDAKQKLIRESMMKKDKPSEFVPKNMAVNFVQHSRFNIEQTSTAVKAKRKKEIVEKEIVEPVVGGGIKISTLAPKKETQEKASDDFHYEKFRKQFKRH